MNKRKINKIVKLINSLTKEESKELEEILTLNALKWAIKSFVSSKEDKKEVSLKKEEKKLNLGYIA